MRHRLTLVALLTALLIVPVALAAEDPDPAVLVTLESPAPPPPAPPGPAGDVARSIGTFELRGEVSEVLRGQLVPFGMVTVAGVQVHLDSEIPAVAIGQCVEITGVAYLRPDGYIYRLTDGAHLVVVECPPSCP